jgi:antitoxin component YwqK of YwqJK toxin-antitoxin module
MKTFLFALFLSLATITQAQYYYNDIVGARALEDRMKSYTTNKVKTITATGYDDRGSKSNDFNEWQEIDAAASLLKIANRNGQQVSRQFYQFDNQLRLTSITDSSALIKSISQYGYDAGNHIISIKTVTDDPDSLHDFSETEEHQWIYANGKPSKMWKIVNGKDSSEYRFFLDEKGNVASEHVYRYNVAIDSVLYYYDDNNRLTDIVRYNTRSKQLLPDAMFEYDDNNRVIQKITVISTIRPDYLIWRYLFNEKGLKTREALFNKQKELRGRIEYQYAF